MEIDIDKLSEAELSDLHHRITERLRLMQQFRAHRAMLEFSIGDRVMFHAEGRRVEGVITKYNRKTVTVMVEGGLRWTVSPSLLEAAERPSEPKRVVRAVVVENVENVGSGGSGGRSL